MELEELRGIIQAIIYVGDEPVTVEQFQSVFPEVPVADLMTALQSAQQDFNQSQRALEIREVAGGYRLSTRPEHHEWIRLYLRARPSARLSLAALETLAVIAYKQPVTVPEILQIRGVKSTSAIRTLLEKKLISPKGRKPVVGRPMLYGTSKEFLIHFGLKDLGELPTLTEFEELSQDGHSETPPPSPLAGNGSDSFETSANGQ
ncbi:MAG: SMC-Scp complex subunit ScpB [Acidobacteria bacterium]|nr:SMC-Scp complex subunit ScpB [Acidobacteriota bacterium]